MTKSIVAAMFVIQFFVYWSCMEQGKTTGLLPFTVALLAATGAFLFFL